MLEIELSVDELVATLLGLSVTEPVYILDSCGVGHLGSHLLIAALRPVEVVEVSNADADKTLRLLDKKLSQSLAAFFTLSYDFGRKLQPIPTSNDPTDGAEPDLFLAVFDFLLIHDYVSGKSYLTGNEQRSPFLHELMRTHGSTFRSFELSSDDIPIVASNFSKDDYIAGVERVREYIRSGDTYQTNLTQQLRCILSPGTMPEAIYWRIRRDHPAPFSAFLRRPDSTIVSASPERFFRISRNGSIEASPIKGTLQRGKDEEEDMRLRNELLSSAKDRAENTMIVDLIRNDLGRVCEFGSVTVEKLCELEKHPTLFHLVSTVSGRLRKGAAFSEILRAAFPCGSITGAPKIRTMQIIDEIENSSRGLSMGAIGVYLPESWDFDDVHLDTVFDLSVAIRTMVIRGDEAVFNVGGGVVIDSDPEKEFDESLLKAIALVKSFGGRFGNAG